MKDDLSPKPEFTRRVDVDRLRGGGERLELAASASECLALARRFGILALERLQCEVHLRPMPGGFVRLTAILSAEVVQSCVITLEPIPNTVSEEFTVIFGHSGGEPQGEVVMSGEAEIVEPLDDGMIDIGEVVAQQLSLALDPYPHKPGVVFNHFDAMEGESPFAALALLRQKD